MNTVVSTPIALSQWKLPFFDSLHHEMATQLQQWVAQQNVYEADDRVACRDWGQRLGCGGWLRYCVPQSHGGALQQLDSRALVVLREILSWHSPLADFSFAMQGLGSGAITLAGTPEQQSHYLPAVAKGEKIAAFALSEEDVGSDVAGMKTSATPNAKGFVLNGSKTWISNGGIADFYVVFAKTDASAGSRGISALVADAPTAGMDDSQHLTVMSPHPLSQLHFNNCQLASSAMLVELHGGFKLAIRTLDIFKASVAAAAIGMARRALHEACTYAQKRHMFGQTLADFQLTQAKLGEMASFIDASALLTYRAAWMRDSMGSDSAKAGAYTQAAAMAKLSATENAQRVIDMALQMHGGQGVWVGNKIEALYRDISALRIYDGASEVQQLIVGKSVLKGMRI